PPPRDAVARERARRRDLAAQRPARASAGRPPSAGYGAPPRGADTARLRPHPPARLDHRRPGRTPGTHSARHRPRAVHEEGDHAMTASGLITDELCDRTAALRKVSIDDAAHREASARVVWSCLVEPGD